MWYDKAVVKVLLMVAKIMARSGKTSYAHEIEKLEKEMFESEDNK